MQQLPTHRAIPILRTLLENDQIAVRRQALKTIWEMDPRPELVGQYLHRALADDDHPVEVAAIGRLAAWDSPQALELLGDYVEGKLSPRLPQLYHCRQAVEAMIHKQEAGTTRLCLALRAMSKSPRKARWARMIAELLQPHADNPDVRKAINI